MSQTYVGSICHQVCGHSKLWIYTPKLTPDWFRVRGSPVWGTAARTVVRRSPLKETPKCMTSNSQWCTGGHTVVTVQSNGPCVWRGKCQAWRVLTLAASLPATVVVCISNPVKTVKSPCFARRNSWSGWSRRCGGPEWVDRPLRKHKTTLQYEDWSSLAVACWRSGHELHRVQPKSHHFTVERQVFAGCHMYWH